MSFLSPYTGVSRPCGFSVKQEVRVTHLWYRKYWASEIAGCEHCKCSSAQLTPQAQRSTCDLGMTSMSTVRPPHSPPKCYDQSWSSLFHIQMRIQISLTNHYGVWTSLTGLMQNRWKCGSGQTRRWVAVPWNSCPCCDSPDRFITQMTCGRNVYTHGQTSDRTMLWGRRLHNNIVPWWFVWLEFHVCLFFLFSFWRGCMETSWCHLSQVHVSYWKNVQSDTHKHINSSCMNKKWN